MTTDMRELASTIRSLMVVVKRETRALAERDFRSISDLSSAKRRLSERLENAANMTGAVLGRDLERDLEKLRALSAENAVQLAALRESVARARARIEGLAAAEKSAGVYGEEGNFLRARASQIGRSA